MVTVKELLTALQNKALDIEFEKGDSTAILGGVRISKEQAAYLCKNQFGWTEFVLSPFEIIDKTEKFARALKRELKDEEVINNTEITFMNKHDSEYGRTFDRITLACGRRFKFTVIYNMKSAGGAYVLYETGRALPLQKFRNMKQLLTYIQQEEFD